MKGRLLIVDDERGIVIALKGLFSKEGYEVETAESGEEALEKVKAAPFHVIITDLSMKGMSGLDLLRAVRQLDAECAVLMITAYGSQRIAVEAMKAGAEDYLPKPFDNDELRIKVRKVMEKQLLKLAHQQLSEQAAREAGRFADMVGGSLAMVRVYETIDKVAQTDATVLIRGESGTGKELVAKAIHFRSPRAKGPFVAVNCAAFSRELVESELFGHEKGSFTGAIARREGKFEAAEGGTLFLDEIGDMNLETQAKLLRVIQEKRFERIGGNQSLSANVRIIAATNQDLEDDGDRRALSRGPLLSNQGGGDSRPAACATAARTSRAWCSIFSKKPASASAPRKSRFTSNSRPRRCAPASRIHGAATCARCARRSSRR